MKAFFGSAWSAPIAGRVEVLRSPFNREEIGKMPVCGEQTVDAALRSLSGHRPALESFSTERLSVVFSRMAEILRRQIEELSRLITREQGKPLKESVEEISAAAGLAESFGRESYRLGSQFQALAVEARVDQRYGFTRQRPAGIQAILTPNTFPLLIPMKLVAPALTAGNAVLLKPARATPLSALRLVELFLEAGLPPYAIACLPGPGDVTGRAICRHPLVDQVCCYGKMETIQAIRSAIGLIPLRFHHGGMSVGAVAADADLKLAVRAIVAQGFENAGQTAVSAGAVYVENPVYEEFLGLLAGALRGLVTGDPFLPATRIGPLTEETRAVRASRIVAELVAGGATVVEGTGKNDGSILAPTLIAGVRPDDPCLFPRQASRELLSPVLAVIPVDNLDLIAPWLDRRTQPAVAIFSRDLEHASQLARSLPVFNVHVNGIPSWRDGVLFTAQSTSRLGRSQCDRRVREMSTLQDIVFHPM